MWKILLLLPFYFRLVCECILSCEKLTHTLENFWIESFTLIKKIINGVDYKGVREIMKVIIIICKYLPFPLLFCIFHCYFNFFIFKGCCEKAATIPPLLNVAVIHQMKALENVINMIFDRNACLLPAYFIVNEIQKVYPNGKNWPHWVIWIIFIWFFFSKFFIKISYS